MNVGDSACVAWFVVCVTSVASCFFDRARHAALARLAWGLTGLGRRFGSPPPGPGGVGFPSSGDLPLCGGEDVGCGVDVTVVDGPAGAGPLPDVQRHRLGDDAADAAQFGTGEPAVDPDERPPVPGRLVFEHADERRPSGVMDG